MDRITSAHVFVTIAERGSLAAAAEALDMSRAMVTRYLAEMEEWAAARLLHRTTRRLSLTAAGELTLARCRELLAVAGAMSSASEAPRGLLRIACAQFMAQTALAEAVASFLALYPQCSVDLQVDNRAVNLVEQRIDMAIRITNALEPNLIARRLGEVRSVVCASPHYLARRGTPAAPGELAGHDCLTYSYFGKSIWQFRPAGAGVPPGAARKGGDGGGSGGEGMVEVPVGGQLSSNESMALLAAAGRGVGITMQPRYAALPFIRSGELVELLPAWQPQTLGVHAIYTSRQHMPPALRALLDHLAGWFAGNPGWLENA